MRQDLQQFQTQKLRQRLTSQQVRYVRLLEMNEQEVESAVEKELDVNPALEKVDNVPAADEVAAYSWLHDSRPTPEAAPVPAADSESLYEYLERQIGERSLNDDVRRLALYIIGNLDSNGYLQRSPEAMSDDIAFSSGEDVSPRAMREALELVRTLDPPGVGATGLQQSLELQLERLPQSQTRDDALSIVREGFDAFAMKHTARLVSRLKIPARRVEEAIALILTLNPKPGSAIGSGRSDLAAAVVPDFQVDTSDSGEIVISFPGRIPPLAIEESFEQAYRRLQENANARKEKDARFILSRYGDARDFINILRQRRDTLYSVMTAIVKLQHDFFVTGDEKELKPMTLKDVAATIGMDVSTVSRATAGKYVATSYGILPLRYFFSEGYDSAEGEAVSARSVQAALRTLIEKEDKRRPLSDEALCRLLAEQGYQVSRRTVAKYRDRLGLPVARLRKNMQL